jgi:hypothetical protein
MEFVTMSFPRPDSVARRSAHRSLPLLACALVIVGTLALPRSVPAQQAPAPIIQPSDTLMEIRLTDGSVLYGRVIEAAADQIAIRTEAGARLELTRMQIAAIRPTDSRAVNGERWTTDPNATRLFFGPTGRSIGKGTGYFAVYELFMPFLSYGVTDRVSLSGGTPIVPFAVGELFYVAPKVTVVSRPGIDLAAGMLAFFISDEDESLGLVYGVGTFGSRDNAVTVGLGLPFLTGGDDTFADRVVVMVGSESRTSARTKFITESYFVPGESGGLIVGGWRFFGERLSADAGLGVAIGDESVCCLPLVNFVYSFGKPRSVATSSELRHSVSSARPSFRPAPRVVR